jgi:hypothetical protein
MLKRDVTVIMPPIPVAVGAVPPVSLAVMGHLSVG